MTLSKIKTHVISFLHHKALWKKVRWIKAVLVNFLTLSILLINNNTQAQNVVVVVNASNPESINPEMVKQIYSDQRNFWSTGKEILLFELPVKDKTRESFANALLNKSAISSQSDWSNRYVKNTIKNTVKIKPQQLVARFVSMHKYAIGYLPEAIAKKQKNLKIVMTITPPPLKNDE